jgi:hypothetical protein
MGSVSVSVRGKRKRGWMKKSKQSTTRCFSFLSWLLFSRIDLPDDNLEEESFEASTSKHISLRSWGLAIRVTANSGLPSASLLCRGPFLCVNG